MKRYQAIANHLGCYRRCLASDNQDEGTREWAERHLDRIQAEMKTAPHGSGIDCGTKFDEDGPSTENKLVFICEYHHLNENGYYDGWTTHKIIITPDFVFGFDMKITGRDRNQIKDYLGEVYNTWLNEEGIKLS